MNKKLIAIDLDGTLLNDNNGIHDLTKLGVLKAIKAGHTVILSTGRPWRATRDFYNELNLNTLVCNLNGSHIHHPLDKNFKEIVNIIESELVVQLINSDFKIFFDSFMCECLTHIYITEHHPSFKLFYGEEIIPIVGNLKENLPNRVSRIIGIIKDVNLIEQAKEYLNSHYPNLISLVWEFGDLFFFEVAPKEANKGVALLEACKYYNISINDTIAFGDGFNDVEMIQTANIGVVLKNGKPLLKEYASIITNLDNFDGGVGDSLINILNLDD